MRPHSPLSSLVGRALPGLLCAATLVACEPGDDLSRFSGRELRASVNSFEGGLLAVLDRYQPERGGCLQLHPDVVATFDGVPLQVSPGGPVVERCDFPNDVPFFTGKLDTAPFFDAPRNAVMEIRDGDEAIIAEFTNFFGRHTFTLIEPAPVVKPGEEVFLEWDTPTDDLSQLEGVSMNGTVIPATLEGHGVRFTVPANFPTGRFNVGHVGQVSIPAERCEGVARCSSYPWPIYQFAQLNIQP